ncbi:uncharacterized protein LOC113299089 isoform X2 [Papaver somniferum]|uniref:uncharacterized protein LOC113299089 isoform X2 n=1 Tax=Papaver somniferum TaxID=3469 RepID=UPI000E6F5073|nr:uncharacterized protein LOC113299089 isoform X2 [Papaver somniferum]
MRSSSVNKKKFWLSIFILSVYINEQFLVLVVAARSHPGTVGGGNAIHKGSNKHQDQQLKEEEQQQQQQTGGSGGGDSTRPPPGDVDTGNAVHEVSKGDVDNGNVVHEVSNKHQQQQQKGTRPQPGDVDTGNVVHEGSKGDVDGGNVVHEVSNKHQQPQLKEEEEQQQHQQAGGSGGGNSTRSQPGAAGDHNATDKGSNEHQQQQHKQKQKQKQKQHQQAGGGGNSFKESITNAGESVRKQLGGAGESVKKQLGGAGEAISKQLGDAGNSVKEAVPKKVRDAGSSFKESVTKQLGGAGESVKKQLGGAGESISKQLSGAGNSVKEAVPKQVRDAGNSFKESVTGAGKQVGDAGNSFKESVKGAGNSFKESIPKKVGDAGNSFKESVTGAGNSFKESVSRHLGGAGNRFKESAPKQLGGGKHDKGFGLEVLPNIGGKLATQTQIGGNSGGGGSSSSNDSSGGGSGGGSSGSGDSGKGSEEVTPKIKKGGSGTNDSSSGGGGGSSQFNVKKYGARADGRNDDTQAFTAAWKAACASTAPAEVFIPKGTYLVGPVKFTGPCKASPITVNMQGFLKASTDLSRYGSSSDWFEFGWVDGLNLIGGGTFDGQGAASWPFNKCPTNMNCKVLPTNVKFVSLTKTTVKSITSLNSKFFHMVLLDCTDFKASEIHISAPGNSPNTDGIHMERSTGVTIANANIGTGDDCVSIGQGNAHVTITGVTCGPGHGISVGSLGRYQNEGDVNGLLVKGCTLSGTMNGIRIKTWANSPDSSVASNMTFEDIVVNNVANPIIIDQTYCPYASCSSVSPSKVKLSDITFKNIRGTTSSPVAVTLECSKGVPCQNVKLEDVHLDPAGGGTVAKSSCLNVQAKYAGTQIPPPCA